MKRIVVLGLSLVLLLSVSLATSAQTPKVTVSGGYLFGNYSLEGGGSKLEYKDNGFVVEGNALLLGPVGVQATYMSLEGSDFRSDGTPPPEGTTVKDTSTRLDVLGTVALPVPVEKLRLLARAGYTTTTDKFEVSDATDSMKMTTNIKGYLAGAAAVFTPVEPLTVSASVGYGLGMKWDRKTEFAGSMTGTYEEEGDAGLFTYKVAAAYRVLPNVSVEAGYTSSKYTLKPPSGTGGEDSTATIDGYLVGAKCSF
ncbi:MAG TPA: outer membrane beta-barrel protein [Firmicutes bacterium]|nr:outer membrane beta-barrel protein [Bacillota bacterium]